MADDFDTAFEEIMKLGDAEPSADFGKTPAPAATAPIPASAEPPAPVELETELEVPAPGGEEAPIPGAQAPEPMTAPQPQALDDAAVERLLAGLASKVPQQRQTEPAQRQSAPQSLVTPQEAELVNNYYRDWEDAARANEVILRTALQQQRQAIFAEMAAVLRPKLDMIDALATRAQLAYFEQKVPDYDAVTEQIGPWVEKQPDYLRAAYMSVMQNGTEDQVMDLITRYKQEMGQAGGAQVVQPPARQVTELSPTAKQAAARLAPVSTKRTTASVVAPATDFDSAFDEAVKVI